MSRMSISASARKGRKPAVPKMGNEETDLLGMVDRLMQDGRLEKLKVYECKAYLRMHKLRLTGKKEVLLGRIREHIEVKNDGKEKYPVSSFVLNCKGDACKGDIVMFEQNIYRRKKGAPREVKRRLCGQRTNAGRIIKESYGTAKQQHTFTIEILWSNGYKPWPPLHPLLIKGRNLYKDKTMRQPWPDEEERNRVIQEKHDRGDLARKSRAARIREKETEKLVRLNRMRGNKMKEQHMNQKHPQEPQQKVESLNTIQQRVVERKVPSLQNVEPGNTRQQHVSSKATSTYLKHVSSKATSTDHKEVLPQKDATRTFKQAFNEQEVSSIQHGGPQPKILSEPTHAMKFKDSRQHQNYQQQNEVLPQEVAVGTSRKAFIDHQAPSQHSGEENTQQAHKHQNHNEEDGLNRTYRRQVFAHQSSAYHCTEYDDSSFQPQFTQHASPYQHGSRFHQNAQGGHQAHQPYIPRNQGQNNAYCAREYNDSSFQPRGKFIQHTNAYKRGSNSHKNAQANHQVHQPLRPRNQDFNSSDQSYHQDYRHQGYHDYRGVIRGHYHLQQNRHQNYSGRRSMTQDQYREQNHHQNYNGHRNTNQNQYHPRQNQTQQIPEQRPPTRPCRYYQQGWCPYGEGCWYSHEGCWYSHDT